MQFPLESFPLQSFEGIHIQIYPTKINWIPTQLNAIQILLASYLIELNCIELNSNSIEKKRKEKKRNAN